MQSCVSRTMLPMAASKKRMSVVHLRDQEQKCISQDCGDSTLMHHTPRIIATVLTGTLSHSAGGPSTQDAHHVPTDVIKRDLRVSIMEKLENSGDTVEADAPSSYAQDCTGSFYASLMAAQQLQLKGRTTTSEGTSLSPQTTALCEFSSTYGDAESQLVPNDDCRFISSTSDVKTAISTTSNPPHTLETLLTWRQELLQSRFEAQQALRSKQRNGHHSIHCRGSRATPCSRGRQYNTVSNAPVQATLPYALIPTTEKYRPLPPPRSDTQPHLHLVVVTLPSTPPPPHITDLQPIPHQSRKDSHTKTHGSSQEAFEEDYRIVHCAFVCLFLFLAAVTFFFFITETLYALYSLWSFLFFELL